MNEYFKPPFFYSVGDRTTLWYVCHFIKKTQIWSFFYQSKPKIEYTNNIYLFDVHEIEINAIGTLLLLILFWWPIGSMVAVLVAAVV